MSVTFGSGDFETTAPEQTTLTSFHLDFTVDLMINITVSECDNGLYLGLVLRTPGGGSEIVLSSEVVTADPGTVVSIPFYAVPEGFYDIVLMSVDGAVAGSFTATWDNVTENDELVPAATDGD